MAIGETKNVGIVLLVLSDGVLFAD